jgi:polyvinyl alcohol dehydrogenase (cytochrome)
MGPRRLLLGTCLFFPILAAPPDGASLYKVWCAACHDHPRERIPSREIISRLPANDVLKALTTGSMQEQAKALNDADRRAVAAFLTGKEPSLAAAANTPSASQCSSPPSPIKLNDLDWNGWGRDVENTRYQPKPDFKADDVPRLNVKWAFGFPGMFTYGQPTILGDRLYVTSGNGTLFALNAQTGCTYWTFENGTSARTAVSVGPMPAGSGASYAAYFGDDKAVVHAVDADTGKPIWQTKADDHPVARVTGSPTLYKDKLYVPVSSIEEVSGRNPKYECCKFQGSVTVLDARTGKLLWKTHTLIHPAAPFQKNSVGTQMYGPAGAAVWSAPTIDVKRKLVYVGTGNSYTEADQATANAILAIDIDTGALKWSNQVTPKDNFLVGCVQPGVGNCPAVVGPDVDFGSSPALQTIPGGKQILLAGQKSGAVYGLDPDNQGKVLWQRKVGGGSALGGVEWGFAADLENVYVPIADAITPPAQARPGITALKLATGEQVWQTPTPKPGCSWGKNGCFVAQSQAVTVIPGVVFSGAMDGHLRAYSTRDGSIVWDFDTGRAFETVNGVKASGGSLDAAGPTVANGILYVNAGYGRIIGKGGNVLLAISVEGK